MKDHEWTKREQAVRERLNNTDGGKLLIAFGFTPYDTETAARTVATMAAELMAEHRTLIEQEIARIKVLVSRYETMQFDNTLTEAEEKSMDNLNARMGGLMRALELMA